MKQNELELLKEKIIDYVVDCGRNGDEHINECVVLDDDNEYSPYADIEGYVRVNGYTEDDYTCGYMNGTGAFVVTSVDVNLKIQVYDENEIPVNIDENEIYAAIESELKW